jgi:hypothetical protein
MRGRPGLGQASKLGVDAATALRLYRALRKGLCIPGPQVIDSFCRFTPIQALQKEFVLQQATPYTQI